MRIGFFSNHNPLDKRAFSGTAYYMLKSLMEHPSCSVQLLGNYRRPNRVLDTLLTHIPRREKFSLKNVNQCDAILSLVSSNRVSEISQRTNVPVVHVTDATPSFLHEFYRINMSDELVKKERRAIEAARLVYYSSDFMMQRAIADFGREIQDKVAACPWGANLDDAPEAPIQKLPLAPLRLLFVGTNWERKGGDVAVDTLRALRSRGLETELHLIGADANEGKQIQGLISHGFLDKNRISDLTRIQSILRGAHFLILPTRADCTPMVVAEANSYSIPVLISNVGGVPSIMNAGVNGYTLPISSTGEDYADLVLSLIGDENEYSLLSANSYRHYLHKLNWRAWSERTVELLRQKVII